LDLDHVEHRYLLACAIDGSIAAYDTLAPSPPPDAEIPSAGPDHAALFTITKQRPGSHKAAVTSAVWYPVDAGIFLSGGRDGEVKVWDANALELACSFPIGAAVHALAMSPVASEHCLVAVGSEEPDVTLCDIRSGGCAHRLSGHRGAVWAVAWSQTSEWEVVTGGREGQLRLWDIRRAGTRHMFDMHATAGGPATASVLSTAAGPSSGHGTGAGALALAHDAGITGVASSPDGLHWVSAGNDDRVRLWDSGTYANTLVHFRDTYNRASKPRQLAFTDDGAAVFHPSGSAIQVFDVRTGGTIRVLRGGHFESINACYWNPVAGELYSGANDNNIVVWAPRWAGREAPEGSDSDCDQWSS